MRFKIVSLDFSINDTLVSFIKEKSEVREVIWMKGNIKVLISNLECKSK